jgi:serine protease Do
MTDRGMTKDEGRMSKEIPMTKDETPFERRHSSFLRHFSFVLRPFLGHFSFVLRHFLVLLALSPAAAQDSLSQTITSVQPKLVKIYGAGGVQRLEAYQSGVLISAQGHVLTAWSYVLDTEDVAVTLADGRKMKAELVGLDPKLEIAVLKINAADLPHFDLEQTVELMSGNRVLAFSNLYGVAAGDEQVSVQKGIVAGRIDLAARRGAFATPYRGSVYVLDAVTNNPGAAGGALTDRQGRFAGLLGKELRSSLDNSWLNYALPAGDLAASVADILAGRMTSRREETAKPPSEHYSPMILGLALVPDVLAKTPPFIDRVSPGTPAGEAGLRPDDLVLFVNGRIVSSCKALVEELSFIDRIDEVRLTVQRGQELVEVTLRAK